jgi:hypothetical protein
MPRAIATVIRTGLTGTVAEVTLAITQDPELAPKPGKDGAAPEVNKDAIHAHAASGFDHGRITMTVSDPSAFMNGKRFRMILEPL